MSWLSSAVHGIGNAVKGVGHVAGEVLSNPIADAVIGMTPLGPLGALGAGALGGLIKPGGNLGTTITGGLEGGASGLAGKGVASLFSHLTGLGQSGGDSGATGMTSGGQQVQVDSNGNVVLDANGQPVLAPSSGGASQDQSIWGKINDAIQGTGGWGAVASALGGDIGQAVNAMGGVQSLPAWAMAAAQAKNASDLGAKADQFATDALKTKTDDWTSRAGLRTQGISGMLNPKTANLSGLLANSGPYAAGLPRPGVQSLQSFVG